MKKLFVLMLAVLLVVAVAIGLIVVASNNNKVEVSKPSTANATTVAPKATATAVPTVMPMATAMPNIATAVPTNVPTAAPTTAVTTLTSLEASEKTILVDSLGYRHAMILESDLQEVTYKKVEVDVENGICLRLNSLGVIGVVWHREAQALNVRTVNTSHDEGSVRKFFSQNGELFTNYVREGYAELNTSTKLYQITGIRFVQLQGEDFFRLVVKGTGNSGNDYPVVTDKPAPTLTPGGDNNEAKATLAPLPDPVSTLVPGGSNNDVTSVNAPATAKPEPIATAKPEPTATVKATATPAPTKEPSDGLGNGGGNSSLPDPADWLNK
jgi:hypothetical protein